MSTKKPKTHYIYQMIGGEQRYVGPDSPYRTVRPPRSVREGTTIKVGSRVRLKEPEKADRFMKVLKNKVMVVEAEYGSYCDVKAVSDIRGFIWRRGMEKANLELAVNYSTKV
jgi:hypothetical protein